MKEDQQQTETPRFERWLGSQHRPAHARRTAAEHAAFLLPHLRPGMRLLDAGCGPGSITVGLAEAVAPGEATGIDTDKRALAAARALAHERGCANVRFIAADVYALPFEDGAFDAAFAHAVFQHLDEPLAALRELRRVLRPGGVIAVADADFDGSIIAPSTAALERASALMARMRRGAHIGKHLRELLHAAGFTRTVASARATAQGTGESTAATGAFWAQYLASPELAEHVEERGWATSEELHEMSEAWGAWGTHPGAFFAAFWCEAVGWR